MAKGDYDVGYGKPPSETRFKPGRSGNPKGRAKGSKGLTTDLAAALNERESITVNGKTISGTRQELAIRTLVARASLGNLKAQQTLFPLMIQVFGIDDRGGEQRRLSANDEAILDEILGNEAASEAGAGNPTPGKGNDQTDADG